MHTGIMKSEDKPALVRKVFTDGNMGLMRAVVTDRICFVIRLEIVL